MAEYSKSVPRNPDSCDDTVKAILEVIIFQTADGDRLVRYEITPDQVILFFEAID